MTVIWHPPNITGPCPVDTPISECNNFTYMYLSLLVNLLGGSADQRKNEQCDKEAGSRSTDGRVYDFIVVGAGSAGCVVANRLSKNPKWKVLLLEAGPEEPDVTSIPSLSSVLLGSNIDWQYTTESNGKSFLSNGGKTTLHQGKMMGGSSSINGLAYVRGNREDYDGWARLGNDGWSYEQVLPFFKKSEKNMNIEALDKKYHGVNGEQYVSWYSYIDEPSRMLTEAFNQAGIPLLDFNGPNQLGTMQAQAAALNGERISSNVGFIRPIRRTRSNLDIKTNSEAIKILIDEYNKAYGIIYVSDGVEYAAYAKKEVIISAGAINSPKLLMLSGIGPKIHLESLDIPVIKDLPVGENLHAHLSFNGIILTFSNETATTISEQEILNAVKDYTKMKVKSASPLASNGPVNSVSFIKSDPDLIAPDIQFIAANIPNWRKLIQDPKAAQKDAILPNVFYDAVTPRIINLVPKSRGVVLLNNSDPNGPPLIFPNYLSHDEDLQPLLKGAQSLLSLEKTEAFQSRGAYFVREKMPLCKSYEWGTDEYFICLAKTYTSLLHHLGGTCKMGPKWDVKAVLDNKLRVHGVKRLRVVDGSAMPVVVRGNTHAACMMIGEKGVDFIIKYWRNGIKNATANEEF